MSDDFRIPPYSLQAEHAVIGGLMIDNLKWPIVSEIIKANDFYNRGNRDIYSAIAELEGKRQPIDLITVGEYLERAGKIDDIGGMETLVNIAEGTPSAANINFYAESVRDSSQRRKLIEIGTTLIEQSTGSASPIEIIANTESKFLNITSDSTNVGPQSVSHLLGHGYIDDLDRRATGEIKGVMSGFMDLDKLTNGSRPGQLVVIAGRPAMGKTTLALNIVENVAINEQLPVLLFSLEMEQTEIIDRLLSSQGQIPLQQLIRGNLSTYDIGAVMEIINEVPLYIDDTGAVSINQIRARAIRIKRKHGLSMIVLDYLQLIRAKAESRFQEVSEISRSLKALAKELDVPVIALSQLNRSLEQRANKRPIMSDLRESGQIEQDADLIAFIYRDEVYNKDSPNVGITEVIIGKQRNGPIGTVYLSSHLDVSRFGNYAGPIMSQLQVPDHNFSYEY
ncbi:MAG: replicative DNA helicase [Candidatus Thiodiazotropha taylori]|nr:replicative DNA helicase [Candidatus Thiodiazotropha endolucinida]MCW4229783.1 replicative DNA helicase [Candidatus Thiodiazotropha taylori]